MITFSRRAGACRHATTGWPINLHRGVATSARPTHSAIRLFVVLYLLIAVAGLPALKATESSLSVVVYNVENFFDVDGVALFKDYRPAGETRNRHPYSGAKLLTKIKHMTEVLKLVNSGKGPDIILFQEFELDRTPESSIQDYTEFLATDATPNISKLLLGKQNPVVEGWPVEAFILKYFKEQGLFNYHLAKPKVLGDIEKAPAHNNVILSRFPIAYQKDHFTPGARVIQEVGIDVQGHELVLFNVHWKSGASRESTEAARVQNARDLRKAVEAVLDKNPQADVLVGGDFNTYYNAKALFTDWNVTEFAIEQLDLVDSEAALVESKTHSFYDLWRELPYAERKSELYRGDWGTLMQMHLAKGLYDYNGIQYVDNSFQVMSIPGLNANRITGEPKSWSFMGERGGGVSDHFPLIANFRIVQDAASNRFMRTEPTQVGQGSEERMLSFPYKKIAPIYFKNSELLESAAIEQIVEMLGTFFECEAQVVQAKPFTVRIGENDFLLYSYDKDTFNELVESPLGTRLRFKAQLTEYRSQPNLTIHRPEWLIDAVPTD